MELTTIRNEDLLIVSLGYCLEKVMVPHCSTLAWKNPMDGGAWKAAVHGVATSRTRLIDFTFTFHFPALEKEMATHSSVLAWRIPRTGEPGGLPSMGLHRVGHDWSDLAAAAAGYCLLFTKPFSCHVPKDTKFYKSFNESMNLILKFSLFFFLFVCFCLTTRHAGT